MQLFNPTFVSLLDAPTSFTGYANKIVSVKADETGLEFTAAGAGTFAGPGTSTDNAIMRFDGALGNLAQNSGVIISDTNFMTGVAGITINNTGLKVKDSDASNTLAIIPGTNLTGDRTLTLTMGDADRIISATADLSFTGAFTTAAAFTTSGANALTLTTTGVTNVTLPTTGTLATLSNKVTDFTAPTGAFSMNSQQITNLLDPTNAQDACTKNYADNVAAGLTSHTACKYATTANLVATYLAGVLTETGFGALSVDGFTPSVGDRIFVKNQTAGTDNGIYTVTTVGNAGVSYVLTRATDNDTSAEMISGTYAFVTSGTVNAATGFVLTTADPITLDVTSLSFTQFSSATNYVAGAGLLLTGLTFSIGAGTGITVNADSIEVDFSVVQPKDGTLTSLAAYNTNGFLVQTAADTFAGRTLTASVVAGSEGVLIVNGNGVSGNPTIGFDLTTLVNEPAPAPDTDYALIWDASSGTNKKATLGTFSTSGVYFHQVGTTPLECWYSPAINSSSMTTVTLAVAATTSTMYAIPFIPYVGGTLDRIGVNCTTATASTVARAGLYVSTGGGNLYPNTLVTGSDSGSLDCSTTGAKTANITSTLTPGLLYYMVIQGDNTTATLTGPTLRALQTYQVAQVLGCSSALGAAQNTALAITGQTFGVLPATFPAGATFMTGSPPCAWVRFSA